MPVLFLDDQHNVSIGSQHNTPDQWLFPFTISPPAELFIVWLPLDWPVLRLL